MVDKVIYKPGNSGIQTTVYKDEAGVERCSYSGGSLRSTDQDLTVPEYLATDEARGMMVEKFDRVCDWIDRIDEESFIGAWTEVTHEVWVEMLEVLPPEKWEVVDRVNIFRMSEMTKGNITAHYASYGGRCWTAHRRTSADYKVLSREIKEVAV